MSFPTTIWTTIREIRKDPERVKDRVFRRYCRPLYEFARDQGFKHADAEDVAQEVLIRVCSEGFLEKTNRDMGRFRTLLLAVARHVIASRRRYDLASVRDRRREIRLDGEDFAEEVAPDHVFDREWMKNLVDLALDGLRNDPSVVLLIEHMEGKTCKDLATGLGRTEHAVENQLSRVRERLRREVERLITDYCARADVDQELAALLKHL